MYSKAKTNLQNLIDPCSKILRVEGPFAETFTTRGFPVRPFFRVEYAKRMKVNGIQKFEGSVAFCIDLPN